MHAAAERRQAAADFRLAHAEQGGEPLQELLFPQAIFAGRIGPQSRGLGQDRDQPLQGLAGAVDVAVQIEPAGGRAEGMVQGVDRARGQQFGKGLGPALLEEIARVEIVGQREDPQVDLLGDEEFQDFVGPFLARLRRRRARG